MIRSSFVEAKEVPIPEKFYVWLEALAVRHLSYLDVTPSVFRRGNVGRTNLLLYHDEFVRRPHPKLIVFIISSTDFISNRGLTPSLVD